MNNLSGDPTVDGFSSFFWWLDDDTSDGSVDVVAHHTTGIDAKAAIDVLKLGENNQITSRQRCWASTHPHVELHVAGHHQNIRYFIDRCVFVQQTQVGRHLGREKRVEGLLMKEIIDVAANFISARISGGRKQQK